MTVPLSIIEKSPTFSNQLSINNGCQGENQEFPNNADPILAAIYALKGVSPPEGEEGSNLLQDEASGTKCPQIIRICRAEPALFFVVNEPFFLSDPALFFIFSS